MQDFTTLTATAAALGDRLKANCKNQGTDVNKAASRYVAERILTHWQTGMGRAPFLIKGGFMFPQHMRPTDDADIVTVRSYTELELRQGMQRIAFALRDEGIEIKRLKVEEIDVGHGDPVIRLKIEAMCGTVRGNTHLDLTVGQGPFAFPQNVRKQELPSMIRNQPGLTAYVQPLEAAVAEKWIAVLQQPDTDYRVKHLADLLSFDAMEVDKDRIAREIIRVCRHRNIPLSVCAPSPAALSWSNTAPREQSWNKLRAERRFEMTLLQAWIDINAYWSATHQALTRAVIEDFRRPTYQPTLVDRIAARQRPSAVLKPL
ncbi:nucleotidyl transferase AbiEii/AbiGii toxin family protein [Sinorhizobium meliloti WSM1022]|uniref:nucleotidyl transferase AbiEii/AbiGii toxin family protein n=1 Tax=Rhizobium meliloti TaxID=382 RepID=UPI00040E6AAB|nr:nucleotidyl transferase AbiEii/AbiGii toxin family protein [Sinorhizobium meliloti]QKN14299.1 nucleotidyl transferase AbiEii/AbiGii toxin family protein [Sinorhizobium meliloti WSM1022]